MGKAVQKAFYQQDVVAVSKQLLGKKLCTSINGKYTAGIIVETEAYRGRDDKACHAYAYKRTARSETMFAEGGHAYVYICYGIHHLMNIVTGPIDEPEVVLIRAVEPIDGLDVMEERRNSNSNLQLTNGPGKLSSALGITKVLDMDNICLSGSGIWLEEGIDIENNKIIESPRVGLTTAEECMNWPWRFRIQGNRYSSKPNNVHYEGYP